jgi:WD40 repeat protein
MAYISNGYIASGGSGDNNIIIWDVRSGEKKLKLKVCSLFFRAFFKMTLINLLILILVIHKNSLKVKSSSINWNYKDCTPSCSKGSKQNKIDNKYFSTEICLIKVN